MLTSVEGVYRNGRIDLSEIPAVAGDNIRVIVTFLSNGNSGLLPGELNLEEAAELRARLQTFAEDWESEEMSIYDEYDVAKARLEKG